MKTYFTILGLFLFSFSSFAFPDAARLSVSTSDNSFLRIVIDGRYDKQGSSIVVDELATGYHDIKIYQARKGWGRNRGNNFDLIYSNGVLFRPMRHVDIMINAYGKVIIDERQITRYNNNNRNDNDRYDRDRNDRDRNDWGRGYDDDNRRPDNRYDNNDRYYAPMNNDMFRSAKKAISNQGFDNLKLSLARQIISSNYFNAAQVRELVQLFSFENNKLELAKYAYSRTVDKNYYFIINDAFSFNQTKEALNRYVREFR